MTEMLTERGQLLENYIGGRRVGAESAETVEVWDPASGDVLARVPLSSAADVD